MFTSCGDSIPDGFSRFPSIWELDFEFDQDRNHRPRPLSMFARERRTGREISMWRDQLLRLKQAPFDTGPDSAIVAYAANAELSNLLALNWSFPHNVIDLFIEMRAVVNGRSDIPKQHPGLLAACEMYDMTSSTSAAYKEEMRALILSKKDVSDAALADAFSSEERRAIQAYNRFDVTEGTVPLLDAMAAEIDLPYTLLWGRYIAAVTRQEWCGLPVDCDYIIGELIENWDRLRLHYIKRDDIFHLYEGTSFVEQRLVDLIGKMNWDWPRTPTGKPELKQKTLGRQAKRYPELKQLQRLRDTIAELRIGKLAATIGADGFSRISMLPFWTKTSRCQPQDEDKIFLPALPGWLHGVLRPPPGFALLHFDWSCEEQFLAAAASGDVNLLADCRSGDPHSAFGVRAGLLPVGARKTDPNIREIRNKVCKAVVHGSCYGMSPYGIAAKTGRSLIWARGIHTQHRHLYARLHQWLGDTVATAQFNARIETPFGWPMAVDGQTKPRTLLNFPIQGTGADLMRIASIAAAEAGIIVCASVHDAFWVLCPIEEIERTKQHMTEIMMEASRVVTGGIVIPVDVEDIVCAPQCLGDVRQPEDFPMWQEVRTLVKQKAA